MTCPRWWERLRSTSGWRLSMLLWAMLQAAGATLVEQQQEQLACEKSAMCSLGMVKPFFGDVMPSPAMKSCLEARSFRREVILLTETRLNPAYQTFRSLLLLGYEHVVMLSSLEICDRSNATWPRLGCVWSSQPLLYSVRYLMDRVAFMARAGRLGYNVLMLDSDVIPFRDVYSLLWAPPLEHVTLAAMRDGNGWLNCGVVYIHNARPDGPATYVLAEVLDRLERWAAQPGYFTGRGLSAHCWDQQMYSDTLLSALAGRPVSYGCWYPHDPPSRRAEWDLAHVQLFGGKDGESLRQEHYLQRLRMDWPAELLTHAPDYAQTHPAEAWLGIMRVPNCRGDWPVELGGPLYPPQRGETSVAWRQMLEADGGPLWPDPEDPNQADAGAAIIEKFAYLPGYLTESWSMGGAYGYWNQALLPPGAHPPVALAHFVHVPGGATNKLTVKMSSNNWDWDVAHAAHPSRGVFFASTRAVPVPDVLALAPAVSAREWSDEGAFAAAVLALLRLAMEMGRAAAYPAPRCNISWMGGTANDRLPLVVHHGFHIPYSPAGKGFNDLRCLWGGYLMYGCQAVRSYFSGGLLAPEYDHLLDLLNQDGGGSGGDDAASASAASFRPITDHLARLGVTWAPNRTAAALGSGVVTVPMELLQPPPAAEAWDVTELAAALMDRYGGPGSGLLAAKNQTAMITATATDADAAAEGSNGRPRVLVLAEVPRLTDRLGPRHELFKQQLASGPDRSTMSCDWILTGRPYRRRRLGSHRHRRRHRHAAA